MKTARTMETTAPYQLDLVHVRGDEAEMGEQHGAITRELGGWEEILEYYPQMPQKMLHGALPPQLMRTAGRVAIERALGRLERGRDPRYLARTRGFMRAVGAPERMSRYFFVMDVLQNVVGWSSRLNLAHGPYRMGRTIPPSCTSLAAWGDATEDGRLLHARNFDFPGVDVWDTQPSVVFCAPEGGLRYGFVTTRGADVVGVTCFNEAGLTLTMHTRFHRDVTASGRGVLDLGHEIIAGARTLDEAVEIAARAPVASSWGVLVSSHRERRAVSLETAGARLGVVEPAPGEDFLAVANRYRDPEMIRGEVTISPGFVANSNGRELTARRYAQAGGLDVAACKRLLASHEDPHVPGAERGAGSVVSQPMTIKSIVVDHERSTLHLSVGRTPTGDGPWVEIPLDWSAAVGQRAVEVDAQAPPAPDSRYHEPRARRALLAYVEAVRLQQGAAPDREVAAALRRATILDPDDPGFHHLAGLYALKDGALGEAEAHLERALEREAAPFYRGEVLLWASRCASARGARAHAAELRAELIGMTDPLLERHQTQALREQSDAPGLAALSKLSVVPHLVEGGLG
jgi:hypothetical protein